MVLLAINTTIVTAGIVVFLIVTLILVGMLLFAKAKLTAKGEVKININNGDRVLTTEPGGTLLSALGNQKIFLPSACGGKGSCGMCKCQVQSGAGSILPTETGFFSYKQQHEDWRLACQVKVKEDIGMTIPDSVLGIKKWECEVISNNNISTFLKEFVVKLPEGENLNFRSGGYIQIDVPKIDVDFKDIDINETYRGDWERMKMFDLKMHNPEPTYRAYSMANHPAEGNIVMLNIRIATPPFDRAAGAFANINPGICSSYIFSRKPGDKVMISGPYGEFFLRETNNEMMFIGGGAGMAPMRSHIFNLFKTMHTKRKVSFWYGARSLKEAPYRDEFDQIAAENPNFKWTLALDSPQPEDNWTGPVGFIHQVIFDNYLKNHENPEDIEYYLCGPPMMIQAVTKMLYDLGVPDENVMYDNFGG
ncbi:MAG: NADH:ubiquinone reductase (Na(+)-transporting) subunit F [Odoribacter splanchnicus]|nr:NADH:ubiquinone reductase (Na(+)-transporting) subunit F [Odoribacter splanchnicus]